ncbi:dynamin family protein [Rossellomorea aquimaris]|uniref:dynamin family protein n=1 Tax=Rossellomorea aquimaris TaxID=189382 RepID=UPI001CD1CB52|nr:dynamin family protein [Rossellomorea aquimaris]MCA1054578.1 dynamin family protein [Rossellomorea aquimaris]
MSRIDQQSTDLHTILLELAGYDDIFRSKGDDERALKAERLAEKLYNQEFILAFCGHFSAGKSTMINYLMGEEILPSSPIPTSANLVKVQHSEEDYAYVHEHSGRSIKIKAPFDYSDIKEYCRNGEDVYSVEIGRNEISLPEGVAVLDTPGVDSTDDAHRLSTESAIHLADAVFYVMDYNHVQSQVNFQFAKEMKRHGVKLYLVVNQIDKHQEEELSFEAFKEGVSDSFSSWGVIPDGIFYTSLKDTAHPYNESEALRELIKDQVTMKEELIKSSASSAMSQLVYEHERWYGDQQQTIMEESKNHLDEEEWGRKESLLLEEQKMLDQLSDDDNGSLQQEFEDERSKILKNAYLMPFETRDLAKEFLESQQPEFKVGFLFSKNKTEEERSRRSQAFREEVNGRIETQLDWHLKTLGKSFLKKKSSMAPNIIEDWEKLSLKVDEGYLTSLIKPGAKVTGDYVLQYCDNVSEDLKKNARIETNKLFQETLKQLEDDNELKQTQLQEKLQELRQKTVFLHKWNLLEEEKQQQVARLRNVSEMQGRDEMIQGWINEWVNKEMSYVDASEVLDDTSEKTVENVLEEANPQQEHANGETKVSAEHAIERLDRMTHIFKGLEGFNKIAEILEGKKERLAHQSFTIALFGAFSAGKSSFANALLGKKVLPVSPNPTTASINRIKPVSDHHHHETADVQIKSDEQLLQDLSNSLSFFDKEVSSLEEAMKVIPVLLDEADGDAKEKIHLSFLRAFYQGYERFVGVLGQKITVNLDEYRRYVADESKSCFVESIDLYYDCDITRRGITLVDTPGADSINARHTGVAFEYIKNADAILFVTYYNHAFAKADREFLIQLGRVKDTFELDKMFFIVNAIDLAKDEEEKEDVIGYVKNQLIQYGIRFPRIFGVSSLLALQNEAAHGMERFKGDFESFIQHELVGMSVDSAMNEWKKGIRRFKHFIQSASSDQSDKKRRISELQDTKAKVINFLESRGTGRMEAELQQELDELVHYLKQRVFFRAPDFYKEAFHSGLFLNESNPAKALESGLKEFIGSIGFDLSQEMRATSLRMQQYIGKQLSDQWDEFETIIQGWDEEILLSSNRDESNISIEFQQAFKEIDMNEFRGALSSFKNTKHFLEKGGKKEVQEALEKKLDGPADDYLNREKQRLKEWIQSDIRLRFSKMKEEARGQVLEQIHSNIEALSKVQDIEKLRTELKWLEETS